MAGFLMKYRCFNFTEKNPVIDRMRTVLQDEGYYSKKRRNVLHKLSGVSVSTFEGWFEGDTRSPRSETIYATMGALGYKEEFVKVRTINEKKELEKARDWFEKQKELRARARARNGGKTKRAASRKSSAVKRSA
jgi:hypothetical protein